MHPVSVRGTGDNLGLAAASGVGYPVYKPLTCRSEVTPGAGVRNELNPGHPAGRQELLAGAGKPTHLVSEVLSAKQIPVQRKAKRPGGSAVILDSGLQTTAQSKHRDKVSHKCFGFSVHMKLCLH